MKSQVDCFNKRLNVRPKYEIEYGNTKYSRSGSRNFSKTRRLSPNTLKLTAKLQEKNSSAVEGFIQRVRRGQAMREEREGVVDYMSYRHRDVEAMAYLTQRTCQSTTESEVMKAIIGRKNSRVQSNSGERLVKTARGASRSLNRSTNNKDLSSSQRPISLQKASSKKHLDTSIRSQKLLPKTKKEKDGSVERRIRSARKGSQQDLSLSKTKKTSLTRLSIKNDEKSTKLTRGKSVKNVKKIDKKSFLNKSMVANTARNEKKKKSPGNSELKKSLLVARGKNEEGTKSQEKLKSSRDLMSKISSLKSKFKKASAPQKLDSILKT